MNSAPSFPKLILPLALAAVALIPVASGQVIFSQDFNAGSMAATSTAGTDYINGSPTWSVTDDIVSGTPVQWAAGTAATGWTANPSAGYVAGNTGNSTNSTYFMTQGWNTGNATILKIDLNFTVTAKSGLGAAGLVNWGALVLSNSTFTDTTVPAATAQVGHIRFGVDASGGNLTNTIRNVSNAAFTNNATGQYKVGVSANNTLSIVYNGSNATYTGIDTNKANITLNGNLIGSNISIANTYAGSGVPLNYLELRAFGSLGTTQAFFDNIVVTAVPEPAISALLGLGVAGFVLLRRRRNIR